MVKGKALLHPRTSALWTISKSALLSRLRHNIAREVCAYLSYPLMLHLQAFFIHSFNFYTMKMNPAIVIQDNISIYNCFWVVIDPNPLLCCAGSDNCKFLPKKCVYELSLNGEIRPLSDMLYPRAKPGTVLWNRAV